MSELGYKQEFFATMFPLLLQRIQADGLGTRIGDVWAHDVNPLIEFLDKIRQFIPEHLLKEFNWFVKTLKAMRHSDLSCHYIKCAGDVNIIKDGVLVTDTAGHEPYGNFWEALGGAWGGRFKDGAGRPRPDGNHYSVEYQGRK
jgi:hypothetical protein